MSVPSSRALRACLAIFVITSGLRAAPVINEIMYHPAHAELTPEPINEEWIELYNPDPAAVDVGGWNFSKGVSFTFAPTTQIPANGFLVVAANLPAFQAAHPGFAGAVVGGWTGKLSNSGETIELEDGAGLAIDAVEYSDEGDWALRVRGPLSFAHRGWVWETPADGGGHSVELIAPHWSSMNSGLAWTASVSSGGTPGAANSNFGAQPHLVTEVRHRPEIPRSTDPITVKARFWGGGITNRLLHWRRDGQTSFQISGFRPEDGETFQESWDGYVTIPAQANGTVIEFFIDSGSGKWPPPARTSAPGVTPETFAQVTNVLVQVDDSFDPNANFTAPGNQPIYRLIMTEAERAELAQIGSTPGEEDSQAAMHGTFISHDGTGIITRYRCGFRNRGFSSALGPPNNYHVSFPHSNKWNDRSGIQINSRYPHSQALGAAAFLQAGIAPQEAAIVGLRVNGANLAETGQRMFGRYVRVEPLGNEWLDRHFPNDTEGNLYRLDDHFSPGGSGEFSYEGGDSSDYSDTFFKETNEDENKWSDLINLARVVSAPSTGGTAEQPAISDALYPGEVSDVLNLDQFYRYITTDALIGNQEGGLQSGRADDVSIYSGVIDPRFLFVPHDMDSVFNLGSFAGNPVTRSIFSYEGLAGMPRVFNHPELVPRYYAAVLEGLDTWFNSATLDPLIDQIMSGWVSAVTISSVKNFVTQRRNNVLGQIQQNYSLTVATGSPDVQGYKRTTDGSAAFSGTFNVARTYSVTVNGTLAQLFYRPNGPNVAGTWRLPVPAGGGTVLEPGLNKVVVNFWDQPNGAGNILQTFTADVLNQPATATYTNVSGTVTGAPLGSISMIAPGSYLPGIPFLVRVDQKDAVGNLDRDAWNGTATLSATNGVTLAPNTVTLTNGMGSALVTVGGGGGGATQVVFARGTQWRYLDNGSDQGTAWRAAAFNDSSWASGLAQLGRATPLEGDEVTQLAGSHITYYFRKSFTVADPAAFTGFTVKLLRDDAAIVYINGNETAVTSGLSSNAAFNTRSTVSLSPPDESMFFDFPVPPGQIVQGNNVIAVEVHQGAVSGTNDLSFDLELVGTPVGGGTTDPGNFTLAASVGTLSANKAMTSLGNVVPTDVSGTLPLGATNWSGVVRLTADTTVPAGATLNIQPGTHILVAGTPFGSGGSAGVDLITQGTINALGTAAQPISMTCSNPANRWGEISHSGAGTSMWRHCLISRACHSPGGGHTGTGPAFRLAGGTSVTIEDSVVSDMPGKTLTNSGATTMTFRRSHFARCVMGPETDASAITIEDCNFSEMLPLYRESGAADDEDNIYIHNPGGRPVNIRRSVFANCGDDALDFLGGTITLIEDCIVRNAFDKGVSLLNNNATFRRCQIIDNDIGISTKVQVGGTETTPFLNLFENCTIVSENHPTNTGDGDFHSVGVHTRNKYGTTTMNITVRLKNCIISAERPVLNDYGTAGNPFPLDDITYSCYHDLGGALPNDPVPPGAGNIQANPLFVDAAAKNFRLQAASPCRDSGDPAFPNDSDGTRSDMGVFPYSATSTQSGTVRWTAMGSPYRLVGDATVPVNVTLIIDPGVSVYADQNRRLTVNGRLLAQGTANSRIVFSHVPGTVAPGDADPIKNGSQTGPPKWGGVRVVDSLAQESIFSHCDFINAQGTDPATSENFGSVGFIRSWGRADHLTFAGTHLRMCYGRNSKLTVTYCNFPDMFVFDPLLGRIEEPNDFLASADNRMEPLKVEFPTTDPEVSGNANYPNGLPAGGHWRCYFNDFHGNRGHQDVFDADSGRWNQAGQFVLDCRYNTFHGVGGDEHIDLGGDAFIAHNRFYTASKDPWTIDTGYSNAISSGDKGTGTTIMVARNVFYDLDHAINCKINTATVFEHNTCVDFHQDWQYNHTAVQDVRCSAVNLFVPNDGNPAGDGGYLAFNIFFGNTPASDDPSPDPPGGFPRLFSGADQDLGGPKTSVIRIENNFIDSAILDTSIGANHPGGIYAPAWGFGNIPGDPQFVDKTAKNFQLEPGSPAKGTAAGGLDFGATVGEWAYILGGPPPETPSTSATFIVGGPGVVAYKWRLDGGAWNGPIQIGNGGVMPRTGSIVRQSNLAVSGLVNGPHTVEVLGQDMAGNWQDADPARTIEGTEQFAPTSVSWTVNTALQLVLINEVLADAGAGPDTIELWNGGATAAALGGWSLTDDPAIPQKYVFPGGTTIPAGGYLVVSSDTSGINLDNDGDEVFLYDNASQLKDSVVFGFQVANLSIGRLRETGFPWALCAVSPGAANVAARVGDPRDLRINEWLAAGEVRYKDDWIELANTSALPVALGGLTLTDNLPGDSSAHVIAPLSFIAPGGFVKFIADGNAGAGPNHAGFALDAQQEEVSLLDADGNSIDRVIFFPQTDDFSQALDSSGLPVFYELPTAGFANGTGAPGYANALAILHGLRITEIMYNASGGNDFDWLELRNIGAISINLLGARFVEGIDFTFGNFSLAPGDDIILVANPASFTSRYGSGVNIGGQYTGRLDNGGETLILQLPAPFDANVLCFRYEDDWYIETDGGGKTLELNSTATAPKDFGERDSWQPSAADGGSPDGRTINLPTNYTEWLGYFGIADGSDTDGDGLKSVIEFALGTDPGRPGAPDGVTALPSVTLAANGRLELRANLPANATLAQGHGRLEITYTVQASGNLGGWTTVATKTPATNWTGPGAVTVGPAVNGRVPVTVQDVIVSPASSRRFMRLLVSWTP
ncbi:MAG: lamin tail domain-containing protein [Verrucomicrobiales bacterium]